MADAVAAARVRIDRALADLERKILDLKARPASAPAIADDDLFAPRAAEQRVAELEAAGREASGSLTPPPRAGPSSSTLSELIIVALAASRCAAQTGPP